MKWPGSEGARSLWPPRSSTENADYIHQTLICIFCNNKTSCCSIHNQNTGYNSNVVNFITDAFSSWGFKKSANHFHLLVILSPQCSIKGIWHKGGVTGWYQAIFSFNAPSLRGIPCNDCCRLILFIAFHISSNAFRITFALISVWIKENGLWSGKSWKLIGVPAGRGDLWVSPWERVRGRTRSLEPEAWKIILVPDNNCPTCPTLKYTELVIIQTKQPVWYILHVYKTWNIAIAIRTEF